MLTEIEKIFYDIIVNEVTVAPVNVWVASQNKVIPADPDKLFIVISMVDAKVIANSRHTKSSAGGMTQIQQLVQRENIQLDIISRDNKALTQRGEVLMAITSVFAQQEMEKNDFKIFRIPTSFANTTEIEGTSQLNRFSIVIPCHVWYRKETELTPATNEYYDDFDTRVDDEGSIDQPQGIIELNEKG